MLHLTELMGIVRGTCGAGIGLFLNIPTAHSTQHTALAPQR
jgi:hypothetical protein